MKRTISAILFDLGGVILNLDYQLTINAFKKLGKNKFEMLYSQAQQNAIFDRFETGDITAEYFREYLLSFFNGKYNSQVIDDAWNAMLLDLPIERIDLLNNLKKDYEIYLFSNTNAIHLKKFREIIKDQHGNANLLEDVFDKTYYSHLIHKRKPNSDAFEFILDDLGLQANEVIFIDDSEQHIVGAKNVGINAYHLVNSDVISLMNRILQE